MTWKFWSYPIPFSFQGFTVVHCAYCGKWPKLGRSYPHFTVMIDMRFGIAERGMLNLNSMVLLYLVPKFISLPYTALSSVSIHRVGTDQNWHGVFLTCLKEKWLWKIFFKIFSVKRDGGAFCLPSLLWLLLFFHCHLHPWCSLSMALN